MNLIKLYDRLTKQIKELKLDETINVYVCGPTVYDHAHLGHGRSMIVFDLLHRLLKYQISVKFVQNITDIADTIMQKAQNEQKSEQEVAQFYEKSYNDTCKLLNITPFTHQPKPTDYLNEMINYIDVLLKNNKATIESDGIYMKLDNDYGRFEARQDHKPFALWMFKDNYGFQSPWGQGRPGWHLECSVMSKEILGEKFHIHGGGSDLIFPHHENEIAQSIGYCNKIPAEIWIHNNMININGEKMSKSLGNFKYLKDIIKNTLDADKLRLLILSYNYDSSIEITDDLFDRVTSTMDQIRLKLFQNHAKFIGQPSDKLINILNNNLNSSEALQYISKLINGKKYNQAFTDLRFMGFYMEPVSKMRENEIMALINKRHEAKRIKNFKLADSIRLQLTNNYVGINDSGNDSCWHYL
jgi:cysteinyl-tRNA synthetase